MNSTLLRAQLPATPLRPNRERLVRRDLSLGSARTEGEAEPFDRANSHRRPEANHSMRVTPQQEIPVLAPMSREAFSVFAAEANAAYAQDQIRAGNWAKEEALAKATAQFEGLLPGGVETPDHFLYEVRGPSGKCVGSLWFAVVGSGAARAGYVYNIRIHREEQRKGYGRAALLAVESVAAGMQLPALRLNVFGHNPGAQALYESLGYRVTSSTMRKLLSSEA